MTTQKLKDDAREEINKAFGIPVRDEATITLTTGSDTMLVSQSELYALQDTLIEKVVAAVEKEVVPEEDQHSAGCLKLNCTVCAFNRCRTAVLRAFNNFRTHE